MLMENQLVFCSAGEIGCGSRGTHGGANMNEVHALSRDSFHSVIGETQICTDHMYLSTRVRA